MYVCNLEPAVREMLLGALVRGNVVGREPSRRVFQVDGFSSCFTCKHGG